MTLKLPSYANPIHPRRLKLAMSTQNAKRMPPTAQIRSTPPPPPGAYEPGSGVTSARSRPSLSKRVGDRVDAAVRSAFELGERLRSVTHAQILFELAEVATSSRQPEQIESALVRLAGRMGGADRVELWLEGVAQSQSEPKLLALWTNSDEPMTAEQIDAMGYPLTLGLWCGEQYQMSLQIYASTFQAKKRWTPGLVRRLGALCSVAAAAERGLHVSQRSRVELACAAKPSVRDATFLNAVLPYALAQAHRHREPLTLICIEIDHLGAIYRSHGPGIAAETVNSVAESIARALRESDVVARLDDDRLVVLMPNAGGPAALNVAEKVRTAILGASRPKPEIAPLTASIGVACYPIDADEMLSLLHAADDAMALAKARGGDQIAANSLPTSLSLHTVTDLNQETWRERVG